MTRFVPRALTLTTTLLVVACVVDELPTPPHATSGPVVTVPNGPNLGALVERFPGGFEISWDPTRNITWTLGLLSPLSVLCDPTSLPEVEESGSFLSVTTPKGVRHVRMTTGGRVAVFLYEGIPPENLCDARLLASGTAVSTTNDNDFFRTGTGTNSFGRRVSGIVELADGRRAHLLIVARALIHPDQFDDDPIIPITVVDRFELRPIGGQ